MKDYIRVGTDYFKIISKTDRYGIKREELKKWNKQELVQDEGRNAVYEVSKYDDFTLIPNNESHKKSENGCFNMYKQFAHKPNEGDWKWTKILLKHIFGEQYEIGLKYLQVLYLHPKQALPVLALVSKERQTGKSTFMDWLTMLFGQNMVIIDAKNIKSDFNGIYATANIIGIEETFIDKSGTIEKIKAISTQKTMTVNMKGIQHFTVPFFGKIIMNSNNEDKFIKIDQQEIRFFVRKIGIPTQENHNILNDMVDEIPAFLQYLKSLPTPDFTKSRMVFTLEELANETLSKVKEESKSWLYKELNELFVDFFENENVMEDEIQVTPIDVKNRFFNKNNQVQLSYIKHVLVDEFNFKKSPKVVRYKPFYNEPQKTGTPYILPKSFFTDEIQEVQVSDEMPF